MTDTPTTPRVPNARPNEKWGSAAMAGWQALPDVLLHNQAKLGLSPTDMLVLVNVLSHWWYVDDKPFPKSTTIAKRMSVTPRTVQRSLQKLIDKGLLARVNEVGHDGVERDALDPTGLVNILGSLALRDLSFRYKLRHQMGDSDNASKAPF